MRDIRCALAAALSLFMALGCVSALGAELALHAGPDIRIDIKRGTQTLPMYRVDHLRRGDQLEVSVERTGPPAGAANAPWVMVLALASPGDKQLSVQRFDLGAKVRSGAIEITDDTQVPIVVVAPQIKTFFGLGTSFQQSADLIVDAISADPQRFIDLQKIDQIDKAIGSLKAGLDTLVQTLKPEDVVDATKAVAAKFGAKAIDPDCLKGGVVDTRCVATSIVSNQDLKIPTATDLGAMAQPLVLNALSADLLLNVRLVAATSSFLAARFHDQYDLAPSSARRDNTTGVLHLFSKSAFQSGDVKTAYVYVPSWYDGLQAPLSPANEALVCLASGHLQLKTHGPQATENYWHDWQLQLLDADGTTPVLVFDAIDFNPETGDLAIAVKDQADALRQHGFQLKARLTGRYAFDPVDPIALDIALPAAAPLETQWAGLERLIAGEQVQLGLASAAAGACIDSVALQADGQHLEAIRRDTGGQQWALSLDHAGPGNAALVVSQIGGFQQTVAVRILRQRAHIGQLMHYDLEPNLLVTGDHLDRIASIQLGEDTCVANDEAAFSTAVGQRNFSCPRHAASNAALPKDAQINYIGLEPPPDAVPLRLLGPRPLFSIGNGKNALLVVPSNNAYKWGLNLSDPLVSADSGIAVQLSPLNAHKVERSNYTLQVKFVDDPVTDAAPVSVYLMPDLTHNELRTRKPLDFRKTPLPNIVNPMLYRVLQQPSGFSSEWAPLPRALVSLPQIGALECQDAGAAYLIHGTQLEQIEWASNDLSALPTLNPSDANNAGLAKLTACTDGLCLAIPALAPGARLKVKLHWIDDRLFDLQLPTAPTCTDPH